MEGSIEERLLLGLGTQTNWASAEWVYYSAHCDPESQAAGIFKARFQGFLGKLTGPWAGQPEVSLGYFCNPCSSEIFICHNSLSVLLYTFFLYVSLYPPLSEQMGHDTNMWIHFQIYVREVERIKNQTALGMSWVQYHCWVGGWGWVGARGFFL